LINNFGYIIGFAIVIYLTFTNIDNDTTLEESMPYIEFVRYLYHLCIYKIAIIKQLIINLDIFRNQVENQSINPLFVSQVRDIVSLTQPLLVELARINIVIDELEICGLQTDQALMDYNLSDLSEMYPGFDFNFYPYTNLIANDLESYLRELVNIQHLQLALDIWFG